LRVSGLAEGKVCGKFPAVGAIGQVHALAQHPAVEAELPHWLSIGAHPPMKALKPKPPPRSHAAKGGNRGFDRFHVPTHCPGENFLTEPTD
jgi:hypothetical protein